jgi:hypothetical protein
MNTMLCTFDTSPKSVHSRDGFAGNQVRNLQAVVVRWMGRQLERLGWSAERWAREAGLSPTTVTRAMSPSYGSVSSVPTLHALARAAGVPSIVDFLDGQALILGDFPVLAAILEEILPAAGCNLSQERTVETAEAIGRAVCGMLEQPPDRRNDPDLARALARASRTSLYRR